MRRRAPRPVASALDRFTAERAPATALAAVQRVWSRAVPAPFAGTCTPDGERDGVIAIACPSAVEAQELDLLSERVVEAVNEAIGRPAVRRLRPQAAPPRS